MSKVMKTYLAILSGTTDSNVRFSDIISLLSALGFSCRIRGDHHIMYMDGVEEIINLQPLGDKAKAYQVRQVRELILRYGLEVQN